MDKDRQTDGQNRQRDREREAERDTETKTKCLRQTGRERRFKALLQVRNITNRKGKTATNTPTPNKIYIHS